jgi:hypothetical protein
MMNQLMYDVEMNDYDYDYEQGYFHQMDDESIDV